MTRESRTFSSQDHRFASDAERRFALSLYTYDCLHRARIAGPTSEMSHDRGWRAACRTTIQFLWFHFEFHSIARGVTAMVVGSGALLGLFQSRRSRRSDPS